jgi:hypothetical protein
MTTLLVLAAVALLPVAIILLALAVLGGVLGSVVERELGVGLFADREA